MNQRLRETPDSSSNAVYEDDAKSNSHFGPNNACSDLLRVRCRSGVVIDPSCLQQSRRTSRRICRSFERGTRKMLTGNVSVRPPYVRIPDVVQVRR